MNCKYCNSTNAIKFGTHTDINSNEIQRYYCKDCKRKFVPDTLPKMQTPINQVSSALSMYYSGASLDGIQRHLEQQYGNKLSESTIYYWIIKFTKQALHETDKFNPNVGDVWIADETGIDVQGKKRDIWFWDIIDTKSRYLLASHISTGRTTEDAQMLIEKAIARAGKKPRVIITDKLRAYIDGIDLATGKGVQHIRSKPFTSDGTSTNVIERFHGTLKDRTKVVRAFKSVPTAQILTDGWLVHYNFFKEHEALGNISPAKAMNKEIPFNNWLDVVNNSKGTNATDIKPVHFVLAGKPFTQEQIKHAYARKAVRKSIAKKKQQRTVQSLRTTRN